MSGAADPFIPPLGDFQPPTTEATPAEVYDQLTLVATYLAPGDRLEVDPGCAQRGEDAWIPMVIVRSPRATWYISPAAAREIAVRVAANLQFSVVFGDAAQVELCFTQAADKAEALATGQASFDNPQEIH